MWVEFVVGSLLYSEVFLQKFLKKRVQHFQIQIQPGMVDEEPLCGSATLNCYFIFIHYLNQFFYFMLTPDRQRKY